MQAGGTLGMLGMLGMLGVVSGKRCAHRKNARRGVWGSTDKVQGAF